MNLVKTFFALSALSASVSAISAEVDPAADGWTGSVGAGLVITSGNTETETGNAYVDVTRVAGKWAHQLNVAGLYTSDDIRTTAEKYYLALQTNYALSDKSYILSFASYDDDRFNGFKYQAIAAVGYGYRVINTDVMSLKLEAGPGYRISKPFVYDLSDGTSVDPAGETIPAGSPQIDHNGNLVKLRSVSENETILRFAESFQWQFSDSAKFLQDFGVEAGSDNKVYRFGVALETTVVGAIAMRVSYGLKYTDEVAIGTDDTDTETAISLAYRF